MITAEVGELFEGIRRVVEKDAVNEELVKEVVIDTSEIDNSLEHVTCVIMDKIDKKSLKIPKG